MQTKLGCDSLMVTQEELAQLFNQTIELNDSIVGDLEQKMQHMEQLYDNQQTSIKLLNKTIRNQEQKLKKSKAHKVLLGVGLGIMTVIAIKQ